MMSEKNSKAIKFRADVCDLYKYVDREKRDEKDKYKETSNS